MPPFYLLPALRRDWDLLSVENLAHSTVIVALPTMCFRVPVPESPKLNLWPVQVVAEPCQIYKHHQKVKEATGHLKGVTIAVMDALSMDPENG